MSKKQKENRTKGANQASKAVTADRAARLFRLIQMLGKEPQTRAVLVRRLRLDVRGFYRDLEVLRESGIETRLIDRRYTLTEPVKGLVGRLPFPDPHLTLGEAAAVAKGRTQAHRKLKKQLNQIIR